jgi:Tfp pilus assembly protein FimT
MNLNFLKLKLYLQDSPKLLNLTRLTIFASVATVQAVAVNSSNFNNPSFCNDGNTGSVCTSNSWPHPWIVFDLGSTIATVSSVSVLLG